MEIEVPPSQYVFYHRLFSKQGIYGLSQSNTRMSQTLDEVEGDCEMPWGIMNGMLWITKGGIPWGKLPERYGLWKTVYSHFRK